MREDTNVGENQMTAGDLLGTMTIQDTETNEVKGVVEIRQTGTKITGIERRKLTVFQRQPTNDAQIMLSTMRSRMKIQPGDFANSARIVKSVETMIDGHVTVAIIDTDIGTFTGWAKFNPNDVRVHKCISRRKKKPYTITTTKYDMDTGTQIAIHKALKKAVRGDYL